MFIYIFGTATEEQLGYKLHETEISNGLRDSRIQNLTSFCLKKRKTNHRESKLSLVAKINQKTVGVCLIPKAASTTIRMVTKLDFLKHNATFGTRWLNFSRQVEYWRIYSSCSKRNRTDSPFRQKLGHLVPDLTLDLRFIPKKVWFYWAQRALSIRHRTLQTKTWDKEINEWQNPATRIVKDVF